MSKKIPFNVKFRPQIESGEYKVIYVEYPSTNQYPVEILKWDSNSDAGCIIGCVRRNGKDRIYAFDENGEHKVSGEDDRLFIVTPEPEMSEWEKAVANTLFDWQGVQPENRIMTDSVESAVKEEAAKLLSFAKQQLLQSGELLTQEHHEKLMGTLREECKKDLPKWKKADRDVDAGTIDFAVFHKNDGGDHEDWLSIEVTNRLYKDEYYLELADLEKLPKDEDHE